ncbi:MAG: helix-turn-helix domain-containing protein [Rhizobiaceae bacterium]
MPSAAALCPDIPCVAPQLQAVFKTSSPAERGSRGERAMEICEGLIDIASALFNVSGKELRRTGRTSLGVSRVRQIAMYVGHVALGLSMNEIGRGFQRDRTTVLYACHLVEDMRDDDDFDRIVSIMEKVAIAAFRERSSL